MRAVYGAGFDPPQFATAYDAIVSKYKYQMENMPVKVNNNVRKFIEEGVCYYMGRDKNYRPVTVLRLTMLCNLDPMPTAEELIATAFTVYEFAEVYMHLPGKIENRV